MNLRVFVLLALISVTGCSLFSSKEQAPKSTSAVQAAKPPAGADDTMEPITFQEVPAVAPSPTPTPETLANPKVSDVEIVWEIPREPVSKYIIYYGSAPDKLDKQVTVDTNELEQLDDAAAGFVYRYDLKNIPNNQKLYISISSVTANGESVRSSPIEVK